MQLFNSKSFRNSLSLLLFSVVFLLNLSRPTVEELQSALKSKSKQGMAALQAFASMDLSWARELMEGHEGKSQQQLAEDARYVLQCVAMCCNANPPHHHHHHHKTINGIPQRRPAFHPLPTGWIGCAPIAFGAYSHQCLYRLPFTAHRSLRCTSLSISV